MNDKATRARRLIVSVFMVFVIVPEPVGDDQRIRKQQRQNDEATGRQMKACARMMFG